MLCVPVDACQGGETHLCKNKIFNTSSWASYYFFIKVPFVTKTQPTTLRNCVFPTLAEMLKVTVNFLSFYCQFYSQTSPLCSCICLLSQKCFCAVYHLPGLVTKYCHCLFQLRQYNFVNELLASDSSSPFLAFRFY